jgi:hypothetical protein
VGADVAGHSRVRGAVVEEMDVGVAFEEDRKWERSHYLRGPEAAARAAKLQRASRDLYILAAGYIVTDFASREKHIQ